MVLLNAFLFRTSMETECFSRNLNGSGLDSAELVVCQWNCEFHIKDFGSWICLGNTLCVFKFENLLVSLEHFYWAAFHLNVFSVV